MKLTEHTLLRLAPAEKRMLKGLSTIEQCSMNDVIRQLIVDDYMCMSDEEMVKARMSLGDLDMMLKYHEERLDEALQETIALRRRLGEDIPELPTHEDRAAWVKANPDVPDA